MRAGSCIALVGLLLAGGLLAAVPAPSASAPSPPTPMQWESHAPILIDGNAAFTDPASGVRSGRGTANDPYVIEQWDVDASSATGVEIRNTDAYFILREVFVHDGGDSHVGVMLYNLQNGWVESVSSNGNLIGFHVELAAATTLNAVNAWDNVVEGVKVLGGSDVVLTQITAERDFDGIFVDGVTRLDVTLSYARDNRWRGFVLAYSSGVTADMNNATGNAGVGMFLWQNTDLALTNTWLGGNGLSAAHLQSFTIADTTVLQGGMELFDVSQGVVRDNVIDRPGYMGIRLGGSNVTLARNSVSRAPDAAIRIEGSADISLDANRIFDTPLGLYAVGTRRLTMTGNRFNGTGVYLSGDTIDDFASHAIATDNLVDGLPIRYVARCADVTLDGVAAGQVIAADCDRLRLANLSLGPTERGVQLFFVRTAEVSNVSVRDTRQDGIVVQDAQDVRIADVSVVRAGPYAWGVLAVSVARMTIERATIDGAGYGLSAAPASVVTIRDSVVDGVEIGILVSGGDFVLERNRIADSLHGFRLDVAQRATIRDNVIERSSSSPDTSGIELLGGTDIVLTGNRVANADTGIFVTATGVVAHHNRIEGSRISAADSFGPENRWDDGYPNGGNVWSDYRGWDDCQGPAQDDCSARDGLGDIPYVIDGNSQDRYPIVEVWVPNQLPVAAISAFPPEPLTNETIAFSGRPSTDPDGSIEAYAWDFGDGVSASGSDVQHAYALAGNYTVTMTVRDNRRGEDMTALRIEVFPGSSLPGGIRLVPFTHWEGFRVPIPEDWSLTLNATLSGDHADVLLEGTYEGAPSNILIDTAPDPTVRETQAYLASVVQSTVRDITADNPDASLTQGPDYMTVSNHSAVSFVIGYSSQGISQRLVLIVSDPHDRYWLLILTTFTASFADLNVAFDGMVDGFEITLAAPPGSDALSLATLAIVGGIVGAGIAAAVLAIVLIRSRRKALPPPLPFATTGGAFPSAVATAGFCPRCGTPARAGTSFCERCGADLRFGGPGPPPTGPSGGAPPG